MSGHHKFADLEATMTPQRQARITRLTRKLERSLEARNEATKAVREVAKPTSRKPKPNLAGRFKVS
jgi:hypothetical protein